MSHEAVFAGLVFDQFDQPVDVKYIAGEPFYVVNDAGFLRHIPAEQVDRQVFQAMQKMIEGHEDIISDQTAKMIGQDDIFSRAIIIEQLKQIDKQFDQLLTTGIPEEVRSYIGMMGFRITINLHGDVLEITQPGIAEPGDDE